MDFLDILNRLQSSVNITFICTEKPKYLYDSLYWDICFIAVVWSWTCSIFEVCLYLKPSQSSPKSIEWFTLPLIRIYSETAWLKSRRIPWLCQVFALKFQMALYIIHFLIDKSVWSKWELMISWDTYKKTGM